jgi:hypothetical protein
VRFFILKQHNFTYYYFLSSSSDDEPLPLCSTYVLEGTQQQQHEALPSASAIAAGVLISGQQTLPPFSFENAFY